MTAGKVRNVGASVRAKLLDLARRNGDEFNFILTRYGRATFARRKTYLPTALPFALTSDFENDPQKKIQWRAFVTKARLPSAAPDLAQVNARLRAFLTPVLAALVQTNGSFGTWNHGTGWTET